MAIYSIAASKTYTANERGQYVFVTPSYDFNGSITVTPAAGVAAAVVTQPSVLHTFGALSVGDAIAIAVNQGSARVETNIPVDDDQYAQALGFLVQTFPLSSVQNTTLAGVSGEMRGTSLFLRDGLRISSIVTRMTTSGSGLTLSKMAIYDSSYRLVARSDTAHASFNGAAGYVTVPLLAPYTVPVSGLYYFAQLHVGTTAPTILRAASLATSSTAFGSGPVNHFLQASLADLPETATPGSNANVLWMAGI